jgi:nucleotide-binding universal stress UspA family protein
MFTRILVPLDGSALAERAIPHAQQFARIFGGKIILLQVLDPSSYQDQLTAVEPLHWQLRKAEGELYLRELVRRISDQVGATAADGSDRVEYAIREGKTAENIVDFARETNADLLVISTHGAGGLSRWETSSVIHKVVTNIYIPVLVLRSYRTCEDETRMAVYQRILMPVDSSRRAECSLPAGIALMQTPQVPVTALPVVEELTRMQSPDNASPETEASRQAAIAQAAPTQAPSPSADQQPMLEGRLLLAAVIRPPELPVSPPYPEDLERMSEQFLQISRQAVNQYLVELKQRLPVEASTHVLVNNSVTEAIHQLAEEEDVDLVVLCAHGQTGRFNWPYGSVAQHYIDHGTRPVLVIQDVPRSQVRPTVAEQAAQKHGRR